MERIREKMKGSGETMTIAGEMMETPGETIESAGEKQTIAGEMIFAKHQIKLIIRMIALIASVKKEPD